MLDMGGNSGYPAGLTSSKEAARFTFNEHSSHAASADASDASWHVAEVKLLEHIIHHPLQCAVHATEIVKS